MAGRHEGRQVVAAVGVPLEHLGADDLPDRRHEHQRRHARAVERVEAAAGEQQRSPGRGADRRLADRVHAPIHEQRSRDVGGRREGEASGAGERAARARACARDGRSDQCRMNVREPDWHAGRILPGQASRLG